VSGKATSEPLSRVVTVLFVEDEDPLRQAASKMLARRGVSVIEAADGTAALVSFEIKSAVLTSFS
jgi:CheY-like chemotaxis protein